MPTGTTCDRCGSNRIIPRARVIDRSDGYGTTVRVGVKRKPDALFFTAEETVDTFARICGECGFTELFAKDPVALYEAYLASRATCGEG